MKCEICHERDAQTVVNRKDAQGNDDELYVCHECAAHIDEPPPKPMPTDELPDVTTIELNSKDGKPPPEIGAFLDAAMRMISSVGKRQSDINKRTCPLCKTTWEKIEKDGRVGCPKCYEIFSGLLRRNCLNTQYGRKHIGKIPADVTGPARKLYLEQEIATAVKNEDFDLAAKLRHELDELGGNTAKPNKGRT